MVHVLAVFCMGGALCVVAQMLIDYTKLTPARILVIYVVAGVFLGAVGVFEPLKEIFGAGITVPLLGFGGAIARGVREAVTQSGVLGAFTGGFTAAAGGSAAALTFGYLAALLGKSRPKQL